MKKVLSLVLVLALVLALAVPAFASGSSATTKLEQSTKYTSTTSVPTINIIVPASGTFVVNPYNMSVGEESPSTDSIVCAPVQVVNKSDLAMTVKGTVTGTVAGNAKFAVGNAEGELTETEESANSVLLKFAISKPGNQSGDETVAKPDENDITHTPTVKASAVKFGEGTDADPEIKLAKGSAEGATGNAITVLFIGTASKAPKTPWVAADKVTATVAYTFTPVADEVTGG